MFGISIYIIQILLILLFGYLFRDDKKRFLTAAFIVLFIVMAFRNAEIVGNDSATSYYGEFLGLQAISLQWPNPGLPIVMSIIKRLLGNYQWVIVFSALWVCFAYYKLLLKYSENGFISIVWFMGMLFYTFLFSALKQAWAMGFICFAFDAIFEKKPMRFLIFVALASLFHFPALVFLPAYWIAKLKINKAFPILMLGVLLFVFFFRIQILNLMTSAYSKGETEYSADVRFISTKFVFMILMLAYGFYQYFKHNYHLHQEGNLFSALIYFMGIAAVIQTFCYFNNIFERLADYYYHFSILYVPLILLRKENASGYSSKINQLQMQRVPGSMGIIKKPNKEIYSLRSVDLSTVFAFVITAFCVWRFISFTSSGADSLTPFYFFWQNI